MAALTALIVSLLLGADADPASLQHFQIGQEIREEGPVVAPGQARHTDDGRRVDHHVAVVLPTLLWVRPEQRLRLDRRGERRLPSAPSVSPTTTSRSRQQRNLGLTARTKFGPANPGRAAARRGAGAGWRTRRCSRHHAGVAVLQGLQSGAGLVLYVLVFVILVLTGTANAVNLTDGLDGLAIGSVLIAWATFTCWPTPPATRSSPSISACPTSRAAGEVTDLLRCRGRRQPRLPVVQQPSRRGVHGRRRLDGDGRCPGNHGIC